MTHQHDSLLNKYLSEIMNERNDGYWKEYFRELYRQRYAELQKQKEEQEKLNEKINSDDLNRQ